MKHALLALIAGILLASSEVPKPSAPCAPARPHAAGFVCLA